MKLYPNWKFRILFGLMKIIINYDQKKLFKRKTQILYKTSLYFIYIHIDYAYIVEYVGMYIDVHNVHTCPCFVFISPHRTKSYYTCKPQPAITAEDHSVLHCLSTLTVE